MIWQDAAVVWMSRWFSRWARTQGLTDSALCAAVVEMRSGLIDATLGGGLVKKRIGRPGQGKRGGFRTLVATNKNKRWFFPYGFPKNDRSNIDPDEMDALKKLASVYLSLDSVALSRADREGVLVKVNCHGQS